MKQTLLHAIAISLVLATTASAIAGGIEAGDRLEMAAVLKAPITPTRAVQIAEGGGGRAYGYGMEVARNGGHWYEVDILRGGDKLELRIDDASGKLLGSSAARGEDAQGAQALAGSKLLFGEAIAEAERVGGGPALEASAAGHGDQAHVDVDVIQDHGKHVAHYRVSLQNGRLHTALTGTDT